MSVSAEELPLWQRYLPGTTAWRIAYHRRQAVESVNAALKGGFVNVDRPWVRVFGDAKVALVVGFALAGYNADCVRAFRAKQAVLNPSGGPSIRHRAKRRRGTYAEIFARTPEPRGPGPPRPSTPLKSDIGA